MERAGFFRSLTLISLLLKATSKLVFLRYSSDNIDSPKQALSVNPHAYQINSGLIGLVLQAIGLNSDGHYSLVADSSFAILGF